MARSSVWRALSSSAESMREAACLQCRPARVVIDWIISRSRSKSEVGECASPSCGRLRSR